MDAVFSQEINVGISNGLFTDKTDFDYSVGGTFEYRTSDPHLSLNLDPFLAFHSEYISFTVPFYMKVIFGEKFRFCPTLGGLVSTQRRYGYTLGLHLEFMIKERFIVFSKNEFYKFVWKVEWPDHFGGSHTTTTDSNALLFSLGIKMKLKK